MKKVMLIFGTRPEAIKMCPLVLEMRKHPELETVVCVTGQHRQMLDQILECFHVEPKYEKYDGVFQFEEVVYVRKDGVEFLTNEPPKDIPVIKETI